MLGRIRAGATWLRYTYPFQLAHGPLCTRYRGDAVRVGHVFVCRSCLLLYATLAIGLAVSLWRSPDPSMLLWGMAALGPIVLLLSWPTFYRRLPRLVRDGARAGAGLLLALATAATVSGAWWVGGSVLIVLAACYVVYARARREQRGHLCDGCQELGQSGVCSGYSMQAERIRAYEDAMIERLAPSIGRLLQERHGAANRTGPTCGTQRREARSEASPSRSG